jgi:hypothetical protein
MTSKMHSVIRPCLAATGAFLLLAGLPSSVRAEQCNHVSAARMAENHAFEPIPIPVAVTKGETAKRSPASDKSPSRKPMSPPPCLWCNSGKEHGAPVPPPPAPERSDLFVQLFSAQNYDVSFCAPSSSGSLYSLLLDASIEHPPRSA